MQGLMSAYPLTLVHPFLRAERMFPDKGIVTATHEGLQRTTYGDWAARTRKLGGVLDDLGLADDARVGTFGWNTARHLELYFAAPCTGRVLHTLNVRLFPEQLAFVIEHAQDEVIFCDRSLLKLLWPLLEDGLDCVKHVVVMDDGDGDIPDDPRIADYEELLAAASPVEFAVSDEDRAAAMCYTSGTTGNPKGVVYSHRSSTLHAMSTMLVDTMGIREADVILPVVPMFHANSWGIAHSAVLAGSTLVLPGPDLSPPAIAGLLEGEKVTLAAGVPTIWMGVYDELDGRDLSALRAIVCGGSAVPRALSERYREKLGLPLLQAWGMTETSPLGSVCQVRSTLRDGSEEELAEVRARQGLASPLVEVRIADPESGEELPWDGEARGELQCVGPWIASGYHGGEGAQQFTEDGWLRTGDVAVMTPDGYIKLVDRTKDLVKSGGEWISSVELENEIMAHPKVREAAVIGIVDEKWGERPLACVVPEDGEELTPEDIRGFLDGRVAKWWIPESIEFIDEVPKTSVGKFSKKTLRERFAEVAT
jgi:fatty-acyl-CoA synthase